MKLKNIFLFSFFIISAFLLSGCGKTSDIKDNFCGVHLNYQYCKCAFHGEFCANVGMSRGEAKDYVYEKYDAWKHGKPAIDNNFKEKCESANGYVYGNTCIKCKNDEHVENKHCVSNEEKGDEVTETEKSGEENDNQDGECRFDSDCKAICEGDVAWKQGCNPRKNQCEKTFDTDCSANVEQISDFSFPKICQNGECVRDQQSIDAKRNELEKRQKEISNEIKDLSGVRLDLQQAMLDANKNCLNGLADMTNVAIMEFATRVSSVMTGGIPSLADVSVDYANDSLNKLYGYLDNKTPSEEQKLKPEEYIKLNCDLYHYFIAVQKESDKQWDDLLAEARLLEGQINALTD